MGFMKFNRKDAEEKAAQFGAIAEGEYELYVAEGEWRPLLDKPDKTPNFNLQLVIRKDVEGQASAGRKIFHTFYISRDPEKVDQSMDFIHRFNLALDLPDGVDFETQEQWLKYVIGKPVKAYVGHKEYNSKTYAEIKEFMLTEYPEFTAPEKGGSGIKPASKPKPEYSMSAIDDDPFSNDGGSIDITDDDLPF